MIQLVLLPATLRLILASALATAAVLLHAHLAVRARGIGGARVAAAWLVPGVGAAFAWKKGARVAPLVYAAVIVAYGIVRLVG